MASTPPAVVIPADRPGALGIARSLGRRGIPVYGIDADPRAIGMVSRFVRACPLPRSDDSETVRLEFLMDLGRTFKDKAVLYPVGDDDVILCSRERAELQRHYICVMPAHETVMSLVTKDGLSRVARRFGVPMPEIFVPRDAGHVESLAHGLPYPVVLKPIFSSSWLRPEIIAMLRDNPLSNPPKAVLCRNPEELTRSYLKIEAFDNRMIIQEVIPGEDARLAYFCFYLDRQSRPLAAFAGLKLRVLPVGFGSATFVRSFHDSDLEEVSLKLLSECGYAGLGGIEFKRDPRDDRYKLIEFNVRFGLWDALGIRCGVDIPYVAYRDALGLPVEAQHAYQAGIGWLDLQRDMRAFLIYQRRKQLSLVDWLKSLRGEKEGGVFAADDWKPAIIAMGKLFDRPWKGLKNRLSSVRRTVPPPAQP